MNDDKKMPEFLSHNRGSEIFVIIAALVFLFILGQSYQKNTVPKSEYNALQNQYDTVLNELRTAEAELKKYEDESQQGAENATYSISELYMMAHSMNFDEVLTVVEYPDTPEALLHYIAMDMPASNSNEINQLTIALLSAKNTSVSVLSALTNWLSPETASILAASSLNDEDSLYLLATQIAGIYNAGQYTPHEKMCYAAVECARNPAVTPDTLKKLLDIPNEDLTTIIQAKLDSMS